MPVRSGRSLRCRASGSPSAPLPGSVGVLDPAAAPPAPEYLHGDFMHGGDGSHPPPGEPGPHLRRVLVLDVSFRPVDVICWQRAVVLSLGDKVDVVEQYPFPECAVRSATEAFPVPAVVRIRKFLGHETTRAALTRRNVLARDRFRCVYCGSSRSLTVDHVVPVSKGGEWAWENLVAACSACNQRKGSCTLGDLGWELRRPQPMSPLASLAGRMRVSEIRNTPAPWVGYLGDKVMEEMEALCQGLCDALDAELRVSAAARRPAPAARARGGGRKGGGRRPRGKGKGSPRRR